MKAWSAVVLIAVACAMARPAAADDRTDKTDKTDKKADVAATVPAPPTLFVSVTTPPESRPRPMMLKTLYATSIGLQAFDGVSTYVGLRRGNLEMNPAMQGSTPTTLIVAKTTMTLTTIAIADQLWRQHHRGQAIAVMLISNGVMTAVAARNASILR